MVTFIIPIIFVMFWKPLSIFVRHFTKIPRALYFVLGQATQLPLLLICTLLQWGRFMAWRLAVYCLPPWFILAYFWLVGPLYTDYWKTVRHKPIPKCSRTNFSLHRDTMVLTDVVHPTQGSFRMVHRGVWNPTSLYRTTEFAEWYFQRIVPESARFWTQIFVLGLSFCWGFYIIARVAWAKYCRKADELWLLFWPPPDVGSEVVVHNLQVDTQYNNTVGIVISPFDRSVRRVAVQLMTGETIHVRLRHLYQLGESQYCVPRSFQRLVALTTVTCAALSVSALEHFSSFSFTTFGHEESTVVLDNSATGHICNDKSMFTSYQKLDPSQSAVATIGDTTVSAAGVGTVKWTWKDDDGNLHTYAFNNCLHFPLSPVSILSVTAFGQSHDHTFAANAGEVSVKTMKAHSVFHWDNYTRTVWHPSSGLPELPIFSSSAQKDYSVLATTCDSLCPHVHDEALTYNDLDPASDGFVQTTVNKRSGLVASKNVSWADVVTTSAGGDGSLPQLTRLQERFLRWHERLNHLPYSLMLRLAQKGVLPKEFTKLKQDLPPCASCLFGKQRRRPRTTLSSGSIRQEHHDHPGAAVSTDQIISAQPGLVPQVSGTLTNERITAVTVFVDHHSDFTYSVLMTSCSGDETLRAKQEFEAYAASLGVRISHYHADNGRFQEQKFKDDLILNSQTISFCAVNAHHQNGIVERRNQTLTNTARTMLLHAARLWPEAISTILWPFALKYAEHMHNNFSLDAEGRSPLERFTGVSSLGSLDLKDFHTFGCPCYVLDSREHVPKWDPRSSVRIFVGFSREHARNVAMVLNPFTGLVSPQYHVVFDDHFQTVQGLRTTTIPDSWTALCDKNSVRLQVELPHVTPATMSKSGGEEVHSAVSSGALGEQKSVHDNFINLEKSGLRRSPRLQAQKAVAYTALAAIHLKITSLYSDTKCKLLESLTQDDLGAPIHYTAFFTAAAVRCEELNLLMDGTINKVHEFIFAANQQQNETYTFKDALLQDDAADFIKAMVKEIDDHEKNNHWTMVPRSSMPSGTKTILAIWSFKRKRNPMGELIKHKARLCAHGGMQRWGESYWETYSPTVSWIAVRAMLAVGILHDLSTSTVDFTLAFPQVDLDIDVYMELPMGCVGPNGDRKGVVLKLNKSLYGLKQASHNWFHYLADALRKRGFIQSQADQCVWFKEGIVLLQYVDDLLIVGINDEIIAQFKKDLAKGDENFVFTDGGDLDMYLGVQVTKRKDGKLELTQPFLIDKIINTIIGKDTQLHISNIPASKELLYKDPDGEDRKHDFNYRQAIGMLTYLQGTSRPDIAMPVHQCARFSSNPKRSHEKALIKIVRYLKGTKDKGIILNADKSRGIECYVDASFAPGWRAEDANEASNLLSRTGYIIYYASVPVHWCSKMQSEITLSTAEAEYVALSQAMRETIPFMRLMTELDVVFPLNLPKPKMFCKVFEDNEACISMATNTKFTPRTKHIGLKYHHFRSWVDKKLIDIIHVDTKEQFADMLTKPLDLQSFEKFRYQISGW